MTSAGQVCAPALAGSALAAALVDPAAPVEPIPGTNLMQWLAAAFEPALHQVDRVVAALAAIRAGLIRKADDLIPVYGQLAGLAHRDGSLLPPAALLL